MSHLNGNDAEKETVNKQRAGHSVQRLTRIIQSTIAGFDHRLFTAQRGLGNAGQRRMITWLFRPEQGTVIGPFIHSSGQQYCLDRARKNLTLLEQPCFKDLFHNIPVKKTSLKMLTRELSRSVKTWNLCVSWRAGFAPKDKRPATDWRQALCWQHIVSLAAPLSWSLRIGCFAPPGHPGFAFSGTIIRP